MPYKDPEKRRAYKRAWAKRNRSHRRTKARNWYHDNRDTALARLASYKKENPAKIAAHSAVNTAVRYGHLVPGPCEQESGDCWGQIQAHHDDYEKPLDVRWLCRGHHADEHYPEPKELVA